MTVIPHVPEDPEVEAVLIRPVEKHAFIPSVAMGEQPSPPGC